MTSYEVPRETATFDALAALAPLQQLQLVAEAILRSHLAGGSDAGERPDARAGYAALHAPATD